MEKGNGVNDNLNEDRLNSISRDNLWRKMSRLLSSFRKGKGKVKEDEESKVDAALHCISDEIESRTEETRNMLQKRFDEMSKVNCEEVIEQICEESIRFLMYLDEATRRYNTMSLTSRRGKDSVNLSPKKKETERGKGKDVEKGKGFSLFDVYFGHGRLKCHPHYLLWVKYLQEEADGTLVELAKRAAVLQGAPIYSSILSIQKALAERIEALGPEGEKPGKFAQMRVDEMKRNMIKVDHFIKDDLKKVIESFIMEEVAAVVTGKKRRDDGFVNNMMELVTQFEDYEQSMAANIKVGLGAPIPRSQLIETMGLFFYSLFPVFQCDVENLSGANEELKSCMKNIEQATETTMDLAVALIRFFSAQYLRLLEKVCQAPDPQLAAASASSSSGGDCTSPATSAVTGLGSMSSQALFGLLGEFISDLIQKLPPKEEQRIRAQHQEIFESCSVVLSSLLKKDVTAPPVSLAKLYDPATREAKDSLSQVYMSEEEDADVVAALYKLSKLKFWRVSRPLQEEQFRVLMLRLLGSSNLQKEDKLPLCAALFRICRVVLPEKDPIFEKIFVGLKMHLKVPVETELLRHLLSTMASDRLQRGEEGPVPREVVNDLFGEKIAKQAESLMQEEEKIEDVKAALENLQFDQVFTKLRQEDNRTRQKGVKVAKQWLSKFLELYRYRTTRVCPIALDFASYLSGADGSTPLPGGGAEAYLLLPTANHVCRYGLEGGLALKALKPGEVGRPQDVRDPLTRQLIVTYKRDEEFERKVVKLFADLDKLKKEAALLRNGYKEDEIIVFIGTKFQAFLVDFDTEEHERLAGYQYD